MKELPQEYIILKFFELGYYPKANRYNNTYQCSCPICREGSSLGKKRRCYYIPAKNNIFRHNCGWSSLPINWIKKITGKETEEILAEACEYSGYEIVEQDLPVKRKAETLPKDSINLSDEAQLSFYKGNDTLRICMQTIMKRRLDTAVNRPRTMYLSLSDFVHKNRLTIPFFNEYGDIEFYQTRTLLPKDNRDRPKYLSKIGGEKTLFNIDKVTSDFDTVYVFEGPINAFFVRNGVAVAGITEGRQTLTKRQQQQMDTTLKFYNKIWVLDSQWIDTASLTKTEMLLQEGHRVFIWPDNFGKKYKDFNDICMSCGIDEVKHHFLQKNSFEGLEGILKLTEIKKYAQSNKVTRL